MKKLLCVFLLVGCTMFTVVSCTEDEIAPSTQAVDPGTGGGNGGGSGFGGKI